MRGAKVAHKNAQSTLPDKAVRVANARARTMKATDGHLARKEVLASTQKNLGRTGHQKLRRVKKMAPKGHCNLVNASLLLGKSTRLYAG